MKRLLYVLFFCPLSLLAQSDTFGFKPFETYRVEFKKGVIVNDANGKAYTLPFDVPFLLRGDISTSVTSIKLIIINEDYLKYFQEIVTSQYNNIISAQDMSTENGLDKIHEMIEKKKEISSEKVFFHPEFLDSIKEQRPLNKNIQYHEWNGNNAINKITGATSAAQPSKDSFFITCSPLKPFAGYKFIFIIERHLDPAEKSNIFTTSVLPNLNGRIEADDSDITEGELFTADFNTNYYLELEDKEEKIYSGINYIGINTQASAINHKYTAYKNRMGTGVDNIITTGVAGTFRTVLHNIYNRIENQPDSIKQKINAEHPTLKTTLLYLLATDDSQLEAILKGITAYDGTNDLLLEINRASFKTDTVLQNQVVERYREVYNVLAGMALSLRKMILHKSIQHYEFLTPYIDNLNFISAKVASLQSDVAAIKRFYKELLKQAETATDTYYEKETFRLKSNGLSSHEYTTRANWYILPDIGATAFGARGAGINFIGSVGINLHFSPLNREATYSIFKNDNHLLRNLSLHLGVTTNWFRDTNKEILVETETVKIAHLWKNTSFMTGVGIRMFEGFRISVGTIWARQLDVRGLNTIKKTVALPYLSTTLDIDLRKIIMKTVTVYKEITQ